MNDMELTSVDVRAVNESLFQNTATKTLREEVKILHFKQIIQYLY